MDVSRETLTPIFGELTDQALEYGRILATTAVERGLIGPREVDRIWDRHIFNSLPLITLMPMHLRSRQWQLLLLLRRLLLRPRPRQLQRLLRWTRIFHFNPTHRIARLNRSCDTVFHIQQTISTGAWSSATLRACHKGECWQLYQETIDMKQSKKLSGYVIY